MPTRPNVLLIVIDQFRADLLRDGPLGAVAQLPNLRALMREAVSFDNHFSVVAPCGPSRVSLLTGQYAMNHRAVRNGTPLRHDTPNLATATRTAGYAPQLFGYTDTAQDPRVLEPDDPRLASYEELMHGFDEAVRMRMESGDAAWRAHLQAQGITLPDYPDTYRPAGDRIDDPAQYPAEHSDTAFLTDCFLERMGTAEPGWFGLLTYIRPHPPLVAPDPYNRMYDPARMPPPATGALEHPFLAPARDKQAPSSMVVGFPDLERSEATTAALRALYLGLASEVDHHIGRVMDWLKSSGQWDDTILVVTADHGEMLGDFGLWGKGTFHDAAFHVPLIIRDPVRPEMHGQAVAGMTESIDVPVTLLDRLGIDVPHAMNGQSLLPHLADTDTPGRACAVSEYDFGNPVSPTAWMRHLGLASNEANFAVLRTRQHRLVQFAAELPPILFDMTGDGEGRDLSGESGAESIFLDLTRKMLCHRMRNPEGTFARTMVGDGGVRTGNE
ncbi:Arylsulfatase A [Cribrihabitans marinus]|uniref:Arylsulfatase A n=1 Tax=Cribrihabitans marinus TaxID=1227549 RepID=A0A1H7D6K6_9RHOB|nr:sulfatase-like hydrolase/transferase [Cribrihabitans marinus]GGH37881.1 sulfatase [Cribrihabitans marinus]SEJ97459.1 Arylsulfatase A [Cribrihabitans marinus]